MPAESIDIEPMVDEVMGEFRGFDLDPSARHEVRDELPVYLLAHRHEYVRTLTDIVAFAERGGVSHILEIGAFFGLVSVCLSKLGYHVSAADIPEYMSMPQQTERFERHGIDMASLRLQDYVLPFEDERFDAIIMCEVMEHLNFNPLPLIKEINRIGRPDSLLYMSLPNLAYYRNRLRFLFGKSMLQPIESYFDQLDPNKLEIANGHWREYTGAEIRQILERLGYEIERQYYFSKVDTLRNPTAKNRLTKLVFRLVPSFKENQTTLALRRSRTKQVFHIPNTVHEGLEVL